MIFLIGLILLTNPSNTIVRYEHQGRPQLSPAWAVVQTGEETVLVDGTRYMRNQ